MIRELVERIYRLLGGDPAKILEESTLSGKMSMVAGLYATSGIPENLSAGEQDQLIADIDALFAELSSPPPDQTLPRFDTFLKVLRLMWGDLGMPQEELGRSFR